jgi:hypothetical protein
MYVRTYIWTYVGDKTAWFNKFSLQRTGKIFQELKDFTDTA